MNTLKHVAIIMDGNGRWAQLRNKPRYYGHIKGARVAKKIITEASDKNLEFLTLYTFSSENWERPILEVQFLMRLLTRYLEKETDNLVKKNIKFTTIGEIEKLPENVRLLVLKAQDKTKFCTGLQVCFAISYSSRSEIKNAVKNIIGEVEEGRIKLNQIDENLITNSLMTRNQPDPDLVIRTSGEYRLSNFMMWQCAYSELFFTNTLWPDFNEIEFSKICEEFYFRNRRFGKVKEAENSILQQGLEKSAESFN